MGVSPKREAQALFTLACMLLATAILICVLVSRGFP